MAGRFWWIPLAVAAVAALIWGDAEALPVGAPPPSEPAGDPTSIVSCDAPSSACQRYIALMLPHDFSSTAVQSSTSSMS
jgi:hypothetical protein